MGECRFEGKDWQGDEYTCRTHKGENPALCSHAAADLERRVEEQTRKADHYEALSESTKELERIADLESSLARLEEEKTQRHAAQAGQCCSCGYSGQEETPCLNREDKTHCEHWWDGPETEGPDWQKQWEITSALLAQAEAREAAMRVAIERANDLIHRFRNGPALDNFAQDVDPIIRAIRQALSPDAGRAQEVR